MEKEAVVRGTAVERPLHYNMDPSGVECIEIVRFMNFDVGNAVKYVWRAGIKDQYGDALKAEIGDIKKAIFYLKDALVYGVEMPRLTFETFAKFNKVIKARRGVLQHFFMCIYSAHQTEVYTGQAERLWSAIDTLEVHLRSLEARQRTETI